MKLISITENFKNYFDDIYKLCETAQNDKIESIRQNMAVKHWAKNPHCLLYRIYIEKKFSDNNGILTCVYDDNKIISISGAERSDFENICIWGKRLYTLPNYRNKNIHRLLLKPQYDWSMKNNFKVALGTWNEDHYSLYRFEKNKIKNRKSYDALPELDISNAIAYPSKLLICNTPQWVIMYYLDNKYIWRIPRSIIIT